MPEPSPSSGAAAARPVPPLTIRLGPPRRARRGEMAPEELRAIGVSLNAGRRRGWKKRLALLLSTPETTIAAWASRSPGNARPIPGAAALAVRLLVDLLRQAMIAGSDRRMAAEALIARVAALGSGHVEPVEQTFEASLLPPPAESILVEPQPAAGG
ncbi:MAG TPA: hypothetical protein VHG92_05150 [Afifellaceae bacterium]|nr:hypothetical protein [Afifellaceae bacterium]